MIEVKEKLDQDRILLELKENVRKQKVLDFYYGGDGVLGYQGILCLPMVDGLYERITAEAHSSRYSIVSGSKKLYRDMREVCFLNSTKKGISELVGNCSNRKQDKVQYQRPDGLARNTELHNVSGRWLIWVLLQVYPGIESSMIQYG